MMSDTSLQRVVNQSLTFHLPCNVQVGERNIQNILTNQLKDDVEQIKNEMVQLQSDKQRQAGMIQSLADEIQSQAVKIQSQADKIQSQAYKIQSHADVIQQLQSDNQRQADEIQQLQSNKEKQADKMQCQADKIQYQAKEIQLLKSRVRVIEDKIAVTKIDKNMNKENSDIITLFVPSLEYEDMTISISRDKTISEVEEIILGEYIRMYGVDDVKITTIYSLKQKKDIYEDMDNKDLPLAHYGALNGDIVNWWVLSA
ncbi:hypothetical protein SNE40_008394 [Patella caerulea]|uniref:Uncharacterized protein n=1 Tax=Patella caerulea TaxID=87958 RepID=A0AAN8PV40_PATCE